MRTFSTIMFLMLTPILAMASIDKEIVTGAFSSPDRAHRQNQAVEIFLERTPPVSTMVKAKRFIFDIKYVNGVYRAVVTHFANEETMLTVLNRVKQRFPESYATSSTPMMIPPKRAATPPAAKKPPVKSPAPKTVQPAPRPKSIPVATPSMPDEPDIIVIDETAEMDTDNVPAETAVDETATHIAPETQEDVDAATIEPEQPASGGGSLLTYGIVAAVLILGALFFIASRRKRPKRPLRTPDISITEATASPTQTTAPAPTAAPVREPKKVVPAPVETDPQTVAAPEPLTPPKPVVPEPPAAPPSSTRKKRALQSHTHAITKEQLCEFAGNRVLVAEDNIINQKVISKLLEGSGIELTMANNGQEAIDILNDDPNFNMILMDANMPVKDGFEATREVRQNILFEPIVVVALSGDVASDDIKRMRAAGMEEQLAKPLRVEALYDVMYQYLDLSTEASADDDDMEDTAPHHSTDTPLNTAEGLEICAGDKEMYAEILHEFVDTYSTSDTQVDACIAQGNDPKLASLMLDVRGVAGNIGADPFSESAETLREAVLISATDVYLKLAADYKKELKRLLQAIETYVTGS